MAAYIALFISLVSLILMVIILIRFKKLFSTDSIIEKTKSQMNRVIMDVNNNANRDIELINESSRRLRALLNEADKKMENFREATELLRNTIAEVEKLKTGRSSKATITESNRFSDIQPVGQKAKKNSPVDPDAAYKVTRGIPVQQGSLFDEPEETSILKDETLITKDGAAFKEVPIINAKMTDGQTSEEENQNKTEKNNLTYAPKVRPFYAANTQTSNKSLKDKVEKLFNQGMQVDDIAAELSCPSSEVQFIIDML